MQQNFQSGNQTCKPTSDTAKKERCHAERTIFLWRFYLLFFHRGLQALVAVELKKTKFHPRDLGQLEFYLEALDRDVKRSNENPSIGIILCPDADKVVVEYAMSRSMSPTMVAEYKRILIPQEKMQQQLREFCEFFLKEDKF